MLYGEQFYLARLVIWYFNFFLFLMLIKQSMRSKKKSSNKLRLIKIVRSPKKDKKYVAVFSRGSRTKSVHFGAKGYQNYGGTGSERHTSEERKKRYIQRHKSRENWSKPDTAGALSRYVLWNKKSFRESVKDYKRRFHL